MTFSIVLLLLLVGVALLFFAFEWLPADVTALGLLLSMIFLGLLPADKAFAGFGSDTFIMILGLLILTSALMRTGVVDMLGRAILRHTGTDSDRLLAVIVIAAATLSAFMSNTASAAFFLPVVFGVAKRARMSPSKLLLPLAFASILSSSVTLISTSTNLVVSGVITSYHMPAMGMFELAPVGIPIAIVGIIYLLTVGRRLIPDRFSSEQEGPFARIRPYLTEALVPPDSPLVGKTLAESALGRDLDLTVVKVIRNKTETIAPQAETELQANDIVLVEGTSEEILKIKDTAGIDIKADVKLAGREVAGEGTGLVEAVLLPGSPLLNETLKGYQFRERYGVQVLGINRHGETLRHKISTIPLRLGDVLLVQGPQARIGEMERYSVVQVLGHLEEARPRMTHAWIAVTIFVAVIALVAIKVLSLPVAVMLGALLVFLTRCVSPEQAYCDVEWKALVLIGCMLGLGAAMEHTGTALYLAGRIVDWVGDMNPIVTLAGFFVLTVLLTQPMSNQAAAIVVLPIAIQTAYQMHLNPRTFAMMVAVAASCSYLTPLEPACLMVYGAGRYRFMDFLRVGSLLTVIILIIAIVLVPMVWPLALPK